MMAESKFYSEPWTLFAITRQTAASLLGLGEVTLPEFRYIPINLPKLSIQLYQTLPLLIEHDALASSAT